jgi:cytoskeletal protein CcmA (bactofilin family)
MIFTKKPDETFSATVVPKRASNADTRPADPMPLQRKSSGLPVRALIDAGLNIKGDLQTDGEVQVDGQITGDISCAHLTVGKDGAILGDIKANEVVVRGKVQGTIRATRVILQESARVEGDIFHDRLAIEEGARFIGASNQQDDAQAPHVRKLQQLAAEASAAAGQRT